MPYFIYILTNSHNTTLYTGVTNNLRRRIYEHKNKLAEGYSTRYNLEKLIYFEIFDNPESAILREKQIKAGSRRRKTDLINRFNPDWKDLYESIND